MQSIEAWMSGERRGTLANLLRLATWLLSYPYGAVVSVRNRLFDFGWRRIHRADVPVISVGNLTVGGTGKTPTVVFLARWLRSQNRRVAILSRGYGAEAGDRNDEALEMEERLPDVPHLQNPDRVAAALVAQEEFESQILLLDDGFQHRRLHRDLNVVLLDATEPFGFGFLLPRGLLREPIRSLRRVDVVIVSRADQVSVQSLAGLRTRVQRYAPKAAWVEARHLPTRLVNAAGASQEIPLLQGKRIFAFCGIGNPSGFFKTLKDLGAEIAATHRFPDHHAFQSEDVLSLQEEIRNCKAELAICTGKDLAKLRTDSLDGIPLWALEIELDIVAGWDAFEERLRALIA